MSTRACVARTTGDGASWEGVYVHHDGNPSAVGARVWRTIQEDFVKGRNRVTPAVAIRAFCDVYVTGHPSGWSIFAEQCYCHSPFFAIRDGLTDGFIRSDEADEVRAIEWFYVVCPEGKTLTILRHGASGGLVTVATVDLMGYEPDWYALDSFPSLTQAS